MDLRDQARVLRRRWRLVAAVAMLGLLVGIVFSLIRTPVRATATLLVETGQRDRTSSVSVGERQEIATQAHVISSVPVAKRVVRQLGLTQSPEGLLGNISVEQVDDTSVVRIHALNQDATVASQIATGSRTHIWR